MNPCPGKSKRSLDQDNPSRHSSLFWQFRIIEYDDFDHVHGIIDYNNIIHAISIKNNEY